MVGCKPPQKAAEHFAMKDLFIYEQVWFETAGCGCWWLHHLSLLSAAAQHAGILHTGNNLITLYSWPEAKCWILTKALRCARSCAVGVTVSNQTKDGGRQLLWTVRWEMADGGADLVKNSTQGTERRGSNPPVSSSADSFLIYKPTHPFFSLIWF